MKIVFAWSLVAAVLAGALLVSRDAFALGPVGIEAAAKVGGGTNPTADTLNPLGLGVGGRAGVSVFGAYGGVSYLYYFGGSEEVAGSSTKRTGKAMLIGFEGGYSFSIVGLLTLRPQVGVGEYDGNFNPASPSPGAANYSAAGKNLYVEPGVTAVVPFGLWFVGADGNVILLPGQIGSKAGFTVHGQIGLRF